MSTLEITNEQPSAPVKRVSFSLSTAERALKGVLEKLYRSDCSVESRRRFSDLTPQSEDSSEYWNTIGLVTIAAMACAKWNGRVLAAAVFKDLVTDEGMEEIRQFCRERHIHFYPVERLDAYTPEILERALVCEEGGLEPEAMPQLVLQTRCPNCGGPLMHKLKAPTQRNNGLFYVCAQHYVGTRGAKTCASGFICGAEKILDHIDPNYRDLQHRIVAGKVGWAAKQ